MEQYTALAGVYDRLMEDTDYEGFARRIDGMLKKSRLPVQLVLELGCGTGSLAYLLSQKGYEMICCDSSQGMLSAAAEKCAALPVPPVFVCQDMCELDLYGTVQAAVCCMDSLNYLTTLADLRQALRRVSLFMERGGLFIFDVKSEAMFREMAGTVSLYESEDMYCVWQYGCEGRGRAAEHRVDIFEKSGGMYRRRTELHYQRAYPAELLVKELKKAGFKVKGIYSGLSRKRIKEEKGRLLFAAEKE